jgi:hypothetical protein
VLRDNRDGHGQRLNLRIRSSGGCWFHTRHRTTNAVHGPAVFQGDKVV